MHVHEVAHTMAGAVAVVALLLPHGLAADGIQERTGNTFRENRLGQRDVRLQHQRVVALVRGAGRSHRHHAGDVGGSVQVLATGIDQQEAIAADLAVRLGRGRIMGQRGVGIEAGNGAEAGRDEIRALAAEFQQHPVDVQLVEHFAPGQTGLEIGKEMAERHAILDHRLTGVGHIGRRLDGLEERAGVDRLDDRHRALQRLQRAGGHLGRVHQQAVGQPGNVVCRLLVGRHRNAGRRQRLTHRCRQTRVVHVQRGAGRPDEQVRQEDRVVGDIIATQIGEPGDIVQRRDQVMGRALFLHGGAHAGQLLGSSFRHEFRCMHHHRLGRQRGALHPDAGQQVRIGPQLDALGHEGLLQLALGCTRQHVGRHPHHGPLAQGLGQGFHVRAPPAQLLQLNAGAGQLRRGLLPVTAVSPQVCRGGRDHQRAHRAREARHPAPALPVLGQVFREVRIGGRDDPGIDALFLHGLAQCGQTLDGALQGGGRRDSVHDEKRILNNRRRRVKPAAGCHGRLTAGAGRPYPSGRPARAEASLPQSTSFSMRLSTGTSTSSATAHTRLITVSSI